MRILYGVVGEGMGHAMRSRVILEHLLRDHEVEVVVSGRAHDYLLGSVGERLRVSRIWGLSIVYEDNAVQNLKTLLTNVRRAVGGGWPENVRTYFDLTDRFEPEVVVSDFESWSWLYAQRHRIPVISLDNMQVINRCTHPKEVLAGRERDFLVSKAVVKGKVPGAFHYLVSTFFHPPVRKPRTTLLPPVLRPAILSASPEVGDHLLVYQTSTSFSDLPERLRRTGVECRIYGLRRDLQEEVREDNLRFMPFDEARFLEDLRTARGVLTGGGFTLMSEAVYLHKPVLSIPVRKQFEQVLNARYLERLGYGRAVDDLEAGTLGAFLERLPDYRAALGGYHQDGNRVLFEALDATLEAARVRGWPPS